MRLLVAGGGTGGHLFPGIAVAEAWLDSGLGRGKEDVLFVGTERGIEARVCPREGWPLQTVPVRRLKGGGVTGWAMGLAALPRAILAARRILRSFDPHVVVGVGGYASGPVVLAARGRPTLVMEQNAKAGMTNRWLGRVVDRVVVSMAQARGQFPPGKVMVLGNPVRRAIRESLTRLGYQAPAPGEPVRILVFGGSQGARGINRVVPRAVRLLLDQGVEVEVVHQAGRLDFESVSREVEELGLDVRVVEFIEDMASAYARAHLVLCRAGATTVAELAVAGRPAILVPFPYAADNHQEANARSLVEAGAARMILEADLTPDALAGQVRELVQDPGLLADMSRAARAVAKPDAAMDVVQVLRGLAEGGAA